MDRRESLIREGLNKWYDADCKGILNWATGVGKTFGAILAAEKFIGQYSKDHPVTVLWVSPTKAIESNTRKEFKKFKKAKLLKNIEFICYASLKKWKGKRAPLVIYDEVHHLCSDTRMEISKTIASRGTLMLSASLTWLQIRKLKVHGDVVHKLSIKDVLDEGFIAPFTIINYGIDLTASEKEQYDKLSTKIAWIYATHNQQAWGAIGTRTRILYSAKNKMKTIKKLVELFPDDYGIIFTMEKQASEDIANAIGESCVFIHSGLSSKVRESKLKQYSDGRTGIRLISTPKILDEGVSIPRLTYGLLASRCSQERQFIQSLGRLLRIDTPNKHAIVIRLFAKGTVEEKWIESSQKDFKHITVYDYNELSNAVKDAQEGRAA